MSMGFNIDIAAIQQAVSSGQSAEPPAPPSGEWACGVCTFINPARATSCEMCAFPNPFLESHVAAAAAPATPVGDVFHLEELQTDRRGNRIFKIVESDRFGQYAFMYAILSKSRCIVIDTGCDTADLKLFLDKNVNTVLLPYLVINTHVHFDHICGNYRFKMTLPPAGSAPTSSLLHLCMGGAAQAYSKNYELTSLASAGQGPPGGVKPFHVSRWLGEGEFIFLEEEEEQIAASGSKEPDYANALQVIYTPGHTLDSISLYLHSARRIFVGDLIYPYTPIGLSAVGADPSSYLQSVQKLKRLIEYAATIPDDAIDKKGILGSGGGAGASSAIVLSCGHVETSLPPSALDEAEKLALQVRAGALQPQNVEDGEIGEYR